jgi:hypothetical protein
MDIHINGQTKELSFAVHSEWSKDQTIKIFTVMTMKRKNLNTTMERNKRNAGVKQIVMDNHIA